ncbi:MAG: hypothetical protein CM1200mP3_11370 [Chloroflexota bacterium]|nr:MAG: hypothetical protein CM1200mP3_11370 [Chloroflexota bacterium]
MIFPGDIRFLVAYFGPNFMLDGFYALSPKNYNVILYFLGILKNICWYGEWFGNWRSRSPQDLEVSREDLGLAPDIFFPRKGFSNFGRRY